MLAIYSSGVSVDHNRGFFTVMVKGISCLFPDVIFTVLLVVDTTFPLGEVSLFLINAVGAYESAPILNIGP